MTNTIPLTNQLLLETVLFRISKINIHDAVYNIANNLLCKRISFRYLTLREYEVDGKKKKKKTFLFN